MNPDQIIDFAIWLAHRVFDVVVVVVVVLIPLALIPKTRVIAGTGYYLAGNTFAFLLWLTSLISVIQIGGVFWTIMGVISIVGMVPIAFVCVFIRSNWPGLLDLVIALVGTFGLRLLGALIVGLASKGKEGARIVDGRSMSRRRTPYPGEARNGETIKTDEELLQEFKQEAMKTDEELFEEMRQALPPRDKPSGEVIRSSGSR
jgi:hypothetical protein